MVERHYGPPPSFVVSRSITTKFGVVIEFEKFSPKSPKRFNDVILCFRLPYPLKFRNSLFPDGFGSGDKF